MPVHPLRSIERHRVLDQADANPGIMNLPAFRLFIDLLAGEGGHGGIEALGAVVRKVEWVAKLSRHILRCHCGCVVRHFPFALSRFVPDFFLPFFNFLLFLIASA